MDNIMFHCNWIKRHFENESDYNDFIKSGEVKKENMIAVEADNTGKGCTLTYREEVAKVQDELKQIREDIISKIPMILESINETSKNTDDEINSCIIVNLLDSIDKIDKITSDKE